MSPQGRTLKGKLRELKRRASRWQPAVIAPIIGIGSGHGASNLFHLGTQAVTSLGASIAIAVWLFALTLHYGVIYVVIGYHPITGRQVTIYVGKTTRYPANKRIKEELFGSNYYKLRPRPWSDTVTRWYVAHESEWFNRLTLHLAEHSNIKVRRPINNDKMNHRNSRRITIPRQFELRRLRDQGIYPDGYWVRAMKSGRIVRETIR